MVDLASGGQALELTWLACDLKSGRISEELQSLTPSGAIGRRLGVSTSAQFDLDLGGAPPEWETATDPGRTMLVGVDTLTGLPLWAGIILSRAGGSSNKVQLAAATPEAYLDRRYTGTYAGVLRDQALIMSDLVTAVLTDAPPIVVDASAGSAAIIYQLADGDDRTVLSALQELAGMEGAPEWTIDVAWADAAQTQFTLPFRVRQQIGVESTAPEAVFDMPGCITDYTLTESYESAKGATTVQAWGDGEGSGRLTSGPVTATDLLTVGWCRWDYRFTPATGLTDPDQLSAHATAALSQIRTGTRAWTLEATASRAPRLGRDWTLGDSLRVEIERSPRHPAGAAVTSRAYAWELDPGADRITPILLEDD
ncbi:hypothetical protein [Streptomyces sp. NPDC057413]|uniref:hypothetical protein n=1 Tax=Streptomyces sp. NPDC057413 TaxID=3346124 RepID=UPI0036B9CBD2